MTRLSMRVRMFGSREVPSCREVGLRLQSYLDAETDEGTARRISRHLELCRRCGMEADTYAHIKVAVARRRHGLDPDVATRLRAFGRQLLDEDR